MCATHYGFSRAHISIKSSTYELNVPSEQPVYEVNDRIYLLVIQYTDVLAHIHSHIQTLTRKHARTHISTEFSSFTMTNDTNVHTHVFHSQLDSSCQRLCESHSPIHFTIWLKRCHNTQSTQTQQCGWMSMPTVNDRKQ